MTTAPAVLALCSADDLADGAPQRSPFWRPDTGDADSEFQSALRGAPRPGEDWSSQGLVDVLVARARATGFHVACGTVAEADGRGDVQVMLAAQPGASEGVMGDVHTSLMVDWHTLLRLPDVDAGRDPADAAAPEFIVRDRLDLLNTAIDRLKAPTDLDRLGYDYDLDKFPLLHSVLDAMVQVWWQARRDEGYTPAAARMMLGLILRPSIFARLVNDIDGTPRIPARR